MADAGRAQLRIARVTTVLDSVGGDLGWASEEERSRLAAMRSPRRRDQFVAGHWLARCLAAEVLGGQPSDWLLGAAPGGAPTLLTKAGNSPGHAVSLSHAGSWVVAALAPFTIGVDVETHSKPRDFLGLAQAAFSGDELQHLRSLPDLERAAAFYLAWTLREAIGKRSGHGLRPALARLQMPMPCDADGSEAVTWQFDDCTLALVGAEGMSFLATGLPEQASRRFWRIEAVPS